MTAPLTLSLSDARRFHCRTVLLGAAAPDVATALHHHGYIQIDPINVCGRMQDLILRNRVQDYREGDLFRLLHGTADAPLAAESRQAFEHHLPHTHILTALPKEAWPYLLATMRHRTGTDSTWSGKLDDREAPLAAKILAGISEHGPLSSEDVDDDQRSHHGWGSQATLAKATLQKLFFHGRVLIARRDGIRRLYDLPERVLPASVLALPEPDAEAVRRWSVLLKLRQRRLVVLTRQELPVVADAVQPLVVEGCPTLYCLKEDVALLDDLGAGEPLPTLLAPLDPLIYDRKITRHLWDFDYTWEVYTPAEKRVRGYYALPLLSNLEIAGHVDPKANRRERKLEVINRTVRRGHRASGAVKELAKFLGLKGP